MNVPLKITTLQDFLNNYANQNAEYIDGEVFYKALPSGEHAYLSSHLFRILANSFNKKPHPSETGGWWIMSEVSVFFPISGCILQPDIAGWKRDRVPERPKGYPVRITPDWTCEVCQTTRKKDTTTVPKVLGENHVPWYWFFDIEVENLQVFKGNDRGRYELMHSVFPDSGLVCLEPFQDLKLDCQVLFGYAEG